jgi:hypothetical protein
MRSVSDEGCRENQNVFLMFINFVSENRAIYQIMWKSVVESEATDDNVIQRMCFGCWLSKVTYTHAQRERENI